MEEFDKWQEKNEIHFKINPLRQGTDILIRGASEKVSEFIYNLDRAYHPKHPDYEKNEIDKVISEVSKTGKSRTDAGGVFCFPDDRIKRISRLDDKNYQSEGPSSGNPNFLELKHHEQYGCERNDTIKKVLLAIEKSK